MKTNGVSILRFWQLSIRLAEAYEEQLVQFVETAPMMIICYDGECNMLKSIAYVMNLPRMSMNVVSPSTDDVKKITGGPFLSGWWVVCNTAKNTPFRGSAAASKRAKTTAMSLNKALKPTSPCANAKATSSLATASVAAKVYQLGANANTPLSRGITAIGSAISAAVGVLGIKSIFRLLGPKGCSDQSAINGIHAGRIDSTSAPLAGAEAAEEEKPHQIELVDLEPKAIDEPKDVTTP